VRVCKSAILRCEEASGRGGWGNVTSFALSAAARIAAALGACMGGAPQPLCWTAGNNRAASVKVQSSREIRPRHPFPQVLETEAKSSHFMTPSVTNNVMMLMAAAITAA